MTKTTPVPPECAQAVADATGKRQTQGGNETTPLTSAEPSNEAIECLRGWKRYREEAMKAESKAAIYERGWLDAVVYLSSLEKKSG